MHNKIEPSVRPLKIAIVANTSWYLYNFRVTLIKALMAIGYEVVAVGPADDYVGKLVAAGIRHRTIPLAGASLNPLRGLRTVLALHRVLRDEGIEVVLSYTPKGNIYGAMAAVMNGLPIVPNVSGLGRLFIRESLLTWLVKKLYRFTFGRAVRVFFQNGDDLDMFVRLKLVERGKALRLPGSGVNLARFSPCEHGSSPKLLGMEGDGSPREGGFVFLLVARLLWDKGVGEYVEAARKVRRQYPTVEFRLLGFLDVQNPSAIARHHIEEWETEGLIRYLGATDDVVPHLCDADCVVLPSYYREGVPRTLLEAAAMAKPIITTDAPGCRDTVDDGETGFLCRLRDADDLADKILAMIEMDTEHFVAMGRRGREKMEREFDERIVIDRYLDVLGELSY